MADFSWAQVWANAGTTAVTLFVAVKLARFQFNLNRRRDEKQAASALREDLRRIDRSLGQSASGFASSFYGITFEAPEIHPWSEPIIVKLAAADARIVAGCMELDRELNNFAATVAHFRLTSAEQTEAKQVVARVADWPLRDNATNEEVSHRATQRMAADKRLDEANEAVAISSRMMRDHHKTAKTVIAELLLYTSSIADEPDPEFMELPEESPRLPDSRNEEKR